MTYIPILDRLLCSVPDAGTVIGYGRTKTYELIKKKIIETVEVDGRQMVVVASLKRLATPEKSPPNKTALPRVAREGCSVFVLPNSKYRRRP